LQKLASETNIVLNNLPSGDIHFGRIKLLRAFYLWQNSIAGNAIIRFINKCKGLYIECVAAFFPY